MGNLGPEDYVNISVASQALIYYPWLELLCLVNSSTNLLFPCQKDIKAACFSLSLTSSGLPYT